MATGIDIGSTGLKLVQIGGLAGRIVVTGAGRWIPPAGEPPGDAEIPAALRGIVMRAPRSPTGVVMGLTGRDVNLQYTFMPPVTPAIFRAMMRHEMEQVAGPAGDEVYVDYCVTAEPPKKGGREGEYSVVIGRAKKQAVEDRLGIARAAGLGPVLDACPNAVALYQSVVAGRQVGEGETALAIDLGTENLEFVIVQGRRLLFARNITSGSRLFTDAIRSSLDVTPAEAERIKIRHANLGQSQDMESVAGLSSPVRTAAGQLGNIIQSSIAFARVQLKRSDLKIARCLLSGGGARLRGLQAYLQGALGFPVEWNEPFKAMDCSGLPPDVVQSLQATPTDMVLALGLALAGSPRGAPVRISLLPAGQKSGRAHRRRVALTVAAALLYVVGLGTLTAAALRDKQTVSDERTQVEGLLKRYKERIAAFEDVLRQQGRRKAQAQLLRNEIIAERALMETLARLQNLIPEGMWVTSIVMDRRGSEGGVAGKGIELKIRGLADEGSLRTPREILLKIATELGDPGTGIDAQASQYKPSNRPGWNEFEMTVTIPQFVPAPEKAEEEGKETPADKPEEGSNP